MPDYSIENSLHEKGYKYVCGIDEAGRGPLCGPVVAAACILPMGLVIEGLNDSKKISEKKREQLFDVICENAVSYSIGIATEKEIDEIKKYVINPVEAREADLAEKTTLKAEYDIPTEVKTLDGFIDL